MFSQIKYSHAGQYFAAVSHKTVYVVASHTLKTVAKLRGHSDVVTAVAWGGAPSIAIFRCLVLAGFLHSHLISWVVVLHCVRGVQRTI